MGQTTHISNSGKGTRPTPSGGVNNIGGSDTFTPAKTPDAGQTTPHPPEKLTEKRQDDISNRSIYPAPYNID